MHVIHAPKPLVPSAKGLKFIQTEAFRDLCLQLAASTVVQELPYEVLEGRLRTLTIQSLVPHHHDLSPEEASDFLMRNLDLIERAWRGAVRDFMARVDDDPIGAVSKVLGARLPSSPPNEAVKVLERPTPGATATELKANEDYAA